MLSGEAGTWKNYVKTTWAEAHPNAPKLDDKLFATEPTKVRAPHTQCICMQFYGSVTGRALLRGCSSLVSPLLATLGAALPALHS